MKDFLVQFGLAGDPEVQRRYHKLGNLQDDPSWLPLGPPGRQINGVKRYNTHPLYIYFTSYTLPIALLAD
jgi:hypothetical protein